MINLSVIIPAHNEEGRIKKTIEDVNYFLSYRPYRSEIIIVENGSTDQTAVVIKQCQKKHNGQDPNPAIRVFQLPYGDKGLAVMYGMKRASGFMRYMADADLSTPIWHVEDFMHTMKNSRADIVIAQRSQIQGQTILRRLMSSGFLAATRLVLDGAIADTQAGFKLFTAEAADKIFPMMRVGGWVFDVEMLYLAQQMGMVIEQLPIPWEAMPGSKVQFMDPFRMLLDLASIKRAHHETDY